MRPPRGPRSGSPSLTAVSRASRITCRLELGELASVTIVLEEKADVLWLSPAAIRTFQGRQFVVIQAGDGQQRVDVRLGIESETRVGILEGVEEGQTIIGE